MDLFWTDEVHTPIETAVEPNNQTRLFLTNLRHLVLQDLDKYLAKNEQKCKISVSIRDEIHFSDIH